MAEALDPENGVAGANLALRTLDAVDPLVEVSESVTTGVELGQRLLARSAWAADPLAARHGSTLFRYGSF